MKISVITVCKNSSQTIAHTIESVKSQTFKNIEHIVCDGGSWDGTVDIIKSKGGDHITLLEGSDNGIYDAINKGIQHATGDVIAILNSDDFYNGELVLEKVANAFSNGTSAVYGDLIYVKSHNTDRIVRYWKSGEYHPNKFLRGWTIPHPSLFIKKSAYEKYGLYNDSYKIAGDYDLILRLLFKQKVEVKYITEVLVKMRTRGASNGSISKKVKVHNEDKQAWKNNGIKPYFLHCG